MLLPPCCKRLVPTTATPYRATCQQKTEFPSNFKRSGLLSSLAPFPRLHQTPRRLRTSRAGISKVTAQLGAHGGGAHFGGNSRRFGSRGGTDHISPDFPDESSNSYSEADILSSVDYPSASADHDPEVLAALKKRWSRCQRKWNQAWGQVMYSYYNWRQDSFSDLQLFVGFNVLLFLLGGWVEGAVIRKLDGSPLGEDPSLGPEWWRNLYEVMVWVLGQDLPQNAGLASQVFAVLTVVLGLASFALVLALIEQVVLEVLESNVKRGSQVYEEGHIVVLAWGRSAVDLTQVTRILGQVVHASKGTGGDVVVVLTEQRDKLEMESICRDTLPPSKRRGTQFVFRQGSPLDPADLNMVAATKARAVIIAGDHSRGSMDSDAQCLRAAVLLDEMAEEIQGSKPNIIVQVHSPDPLGLLDFACSQRVIPVPTFLINARRIARVLRHPIASVFSHMLTDFSSSAHAAILRQTSRLMGKRFRDIHFYFPNAIVLGIVNNVTGACQLNPHPSRRLRPGDALILMCSSNPSHQLPLEAPLKVEAGNWDPSSYTLISHDTEPLGVDSVGASMAAFGRGHKQASRDLLSRKSICLSVDDEESAADETRARQCGNGMYILPMQFSNTLAQTTGLLICGWSSDEFGWTLLEELDHGPSPLPPGAHITLFNNHAWDESIDELCCEHGISNVHIRHIKGDPRRRTSMRKLLDIASFNAVVALSDSLWADTVHLEEGEGRSSLAQAKMLSLDASMLVVQLNIRLLLEERGLPDVNIIVQRKSYIGTTRFESTSRLPISISIVSASFSAKTLTQVAFEPQFLWIYSELGKTSDLVVQDSSSFAAVGEELSYLQLQDRCLSVHQVLMGSYYIPSSGEQPLTVMVNPQGVEARSQKIVWNCGDGRRKIVTLALKQTIELASMASSSSSSGSSISTGSLVLNSSLASAGTMASSVGSRDQEAAEGNPSQKLAHQGPGWFWAGNGTQAAGQGLGGERGGIGSEQHAASRGGAGVVEGRVQRGMLAAVAGSAVQLKDGGSPRDAEEECGEEEAGMQGEADAIRVNGMAEHFVRKI